MILPLIILYVVTLVYLAITERFRNFASLIGLQGWLLFAVALVRLHAINPAELAFICLETLLFKGILVPGLLFAVIRRTKINRVSRSGSTQSGSLLLSLVALAVSASVTYYIADTTIDLVFFGVAFYSLLSGLILIVMRRRIFSHMVGFLVIENGVFLFSTAIGVEMPLLINFAILLDILISVLILGICYLIFSVLIAAAAFTVRRRSLLRLTGAAFYAVQAAFAVRIVAGGLYGETSAVWFAFDAAGTLFYCLLCIVSAFAFFHSKASLHDCDLRQTRTYAGLLMLLTTAIAGAYFASNLAVTWIFLEATTLCSAGIVYHRRTAQALEAAWKYVFVCSTGIAMAYLGILLLGLGSMLLSELLGLSDLVLRFLKLCGELIDLLLLTLSHDHLLLGRCQLTGQVLGLCA